MNFGKYDDTHVEEEEKKNADRWRFYFVGGYLQGYSTQQIEILF